MHTATRTLVKNFPGSKGRGIVWTAHIEASGQFGKTLCGRTLKERYAVGGWRNPMMSICSVCLKKEG